ncbi:NUDIX domain-containing protein [Actinosynnema pretiosum]|uniref:NUDIX domain-containing protein n=1 Tax=Actinosynnema pretiosum TaxID=42197 RepID=UPI001E3F38A0|nr:NUDIX domain-containing protein [Actinosynnema pretiosum]
MRRAGSGYGDGRLAFPAGHVDLGETPLECVVREVEEKLGLRLVRGLLLRRGLMFRRSQEPRVDVFFRVPARGWAGVPQIREPGKCTGLVWADPHALPQGVLGYVGRALDNDRSGRGYDEVGWKR